MICDTAELSLMEASEMELFIIFFEFGNVYFEYKHK